MKLLHNSTEDTRMSVYDSVREDSSTQIFLPSGTKHSWQPLHCPKLPRCNLTYTLLYWTIRRITWSSLCNCLSELPIKPHAIVVNHRTRESISKDEKPLKNNSSVLKYIRSSQTWRIQTDKWNCILSSCHGIEQFLQTVISAPWNVQELCC